MSIEFNEIDIVIEEKKITFKEGQGEFSVIQEAEPRKWHELMETKNNIVKYRIHFGWRQYAEISLPLNGEGHKLLENLKPSLESPFQFEVHEDPVKIETVGGTGEINEDP